MPSIARACVVLLALSVLPTRAFAEPPDFSAVDAAASDAVASGEIPGAVILVGQGSRILYHRAFGLRQVVPSAEPMTEDTVFDLASLTKPLGTTLAVMSLAERGRIRLDAPLGAYLREFRGRGFREVTIRQILAHRAGFSAVPPEAAVRPGFPRAARLLAPATIRRMWAPWPTPDSPRALGWDVNSPYAAPMELFFPAGSVGHTGFTGTMVWVDPPTRTYMIVLTSRLHPSGNDSGRIRELRTRVAAAVGAALFYEPTAVAVGAGGGGEPGPAADAPL